MKTRVREFRAAQGLTQQQLAALVRVSARTIISIEKGQYNPSLMLAYRLAEVFGTTVEELAEHTDERDRYVADRSGRAAMGLLNALLAGGCFCALLLYAAFRLPAILAVAITLCAVLALQLLLLAAANRYYEKRL